LGSLGGNTLSIAVSIIKILIGKDTIRILEFRSKNLENEKTLGKF
jgi:hypothetical protein